MKYRLLLWFLLFLFVITLFVSCSSKTVETTTTTTAESTSQIVATTRPQTTTAVSTTTTDTKVPDSTMLPSIQKISPIEAKAMIDQGGVTIVDVRRIDEFEQGHIPGAILVPNETILTEATEKLPDQNAVLLIYCRSGRRSAEAAEKLVSLGYRHVYDFGGILDWPYEITQ